VLLLSGKVRYKYNMSVHHVTMRIALDYLLQIVNGHASYSQITYILVMQRIIFAIVPYALLHLKRFPIAKYAT